MQVVLKHSVPLEQVHPVAILGGMPQEPVEHTPAEQAYPLPRIEQSVEEPQGTQRLPVQRPLLQSEFIEQVKPSANGGIPDVMQVPALHS